MIENKSIFKCIKKQLPEHDGKILVQYENGDYHQMLYFDSSMLKFKKYIKSKHNDWSGKVVRWCYVEDLDKIL